MHTYRFAALILIGVLGFGITACGSDSKSKTSGGENSFRAPVSINKISEFCSSGLTLDSVESRIAKDIKKLQGNVPFPSPESEVQKEANRHYYYSYSPKCLVNTSSYWEPSWGSMAGLGFVTTDGRFQIYTEFSSTFFSARISHCENGKMKDRISVRKGPETPMSERKISKDNIRHELCSFNPKKMSR